MAQRRNPVVEDLARIKRELLALSKMRIHVGILGDADGDLLMIAAVHEYGCTIKVTERMRGYLHHVGLHLKKSTDQINIPERSFIRASYDTGKQSIDSVSRDAINRVISGEWNAEQAAKSIGLFCVQMTQEFINTGKVEPPDSQYTLDHKNQKTTLVESGRLVESITFEIEEVG